MNVDENPTQPCVNCGHDLENCTCFVYGDNYETIDMERHTK